MIVRVLALAVAVGASGAARAADKVVHYGPPAAWVKPAPLPAIPKVEPGATYALVLYDEQTRYGEHDGETYVETANLVATEDGLQDWGSLSKEWDPETQSLTIHKLHILRDGQVIDALKSDKFEVLRRETNLESSMLDGRLTATVQIRGLRVGDIIDAAYTRKFRDPLGADRFEDATSIFNDGVAGRIRVRALWPKTSAMRWRVTPGFDQPTVTRTEEGTELVADMLSVKAPKLPVGAPMRYADQGAIEFSQFKDWSEISALLASRYRQAATLEPTSPLKAEAAKIRAASTDPVVRAALALKLVESQVRYVYVGMGEGALVPAAADETWRRRFGDCKAKTVLLMALLAELDLPSEPSLVNSSGWGDGLDKHLPRIGLFDHVIVRLPLGGKVYWLDGTRLGDESLANLETPAYDWTLPLRASGGALEAMVQTAPHRPYADVVMRVDASAGVDAPADVVIETLMRGDAAIAMNRDVIAAPRDEMARSLRKSWGARITWVDFDRAEWTFDAARAEMLFTTHGKGKIEWRQEEGVPRRWQVDGSVLYLATYDRDAEQDQEAPYAVKFPSYERWVTSVIVPGKGDGFRVMGRNVEETFGGFAIKRRASLDGNRFLMLSSSRAITPEISAAEGHAATARTKRADQEFGISALQIAPPDAKPDPVNASPINQGYEALWAGRHDEAARLFERAKRDKAQAYYGYLGLVEVEINRKNYVKALKLCDEGEARAPAPKAYADGWTLTRGRVLRVAKTPDKAEALLTAALVARPDSIALLRDLAVTHVTLDRRDLAAADLDRAFKLDPKDIGLLRQRTGMAIQMKTYDEAIARSEAALAIDPDNIWLVLDQASAYAAAKRYDPALRAVRDAFRIDPLSVPTLSASSQINLDRGQFDLAIADSDRALALQPGDAMLLNNRCWARATVGKDLDKALADCDGALKASPDFAGALDSRALVHARANRLDAALRDYNAALALAPKMAASLYGRGLVKLKTGDTASGRADLAAAKVISPDVETQFAGYGLKPE